MKIIQISIILMYPVLGKVLEIPMKLKWSWDKRKARVDISLQCRQNQEDGHIDIYDEVQVVTGEQGGHLTDDEQHEGGQEDRHHVAGEGPAKGDVHKDSSLFLFVDVAMVDGLEDVLE